MNIMDRSKDFIEHPNVADGLAPCGTALHPQKRDADLPSIDSNSVEAHSFSLCLCNRGPHVCNVSLNVKGQQINPVSCD